MKQSDSIRIDVQTLKKLPTLSYSAQRIMSLTNQEMTHLDDLIMIIENDPPILSKVLGVANIIYYGLSSPITSIKDALFKIGFNTLKNIALGISIFSLFRYKGSKERVYKRLFKHSIATGLISRYIAENVLDTKEELYFTSGILHDIGFFALYYLYFDIFIKIENSVIQGRKLIEAENSLIDLDHTIIGKWLSEWWGLPESIGDVILYHHDDPLKIDNKYKKYISLVHLSDYIASSIGYGVFHGSGEFIFHEKGVYSIFDLPEINELIIQIKEHLTLESLDII